MPASTFQQQKLRVCEVCSAYLGLHDNDRRLADHFGGKLHLGFIEIREKLEKLRVSCTVQIDWFRNGPKESPKSIFLCRKQLWRSKKKCGRGDEKNVKKKRESGSGRWNESGNVKERENGRENEKERGSVGGNTNDLTINFLCTWRLHGNWQECFHFRSRSKSGERYRYVSNCWNCWKINSA